MVKQNRNKQNKITAVVNLCLSIECPVYNSKQYKCTKYDCVKKCHLIKGYPSIGENRIGFEHKEFVGVKEIELNSIGLFLEKYSKSVVAVLQYLNKQYFEGNNDNKI